MKAILEALPAELYCRFSNASSASGELRLPKETIVPRLKDWAARYAAALKQDRPDELLAIGREMFDALNSRHTGGEPWISQWMKATGPRDLEILVDQTRIDAEFERALFAAPWELLADNAGHLADDAVQLFGIWRRVGRESNPEAAKYGDLFMAFMAAAPEDVEPELDFEAEEYAILEATKRTNLRLFVEETGNITQLGERLGGDGPFQALHLSCHGGIDDERRPFLALEDDDGRMDSVDAARLCGALGGDDSMPPLVFLSACRTAERRDESEQTSSSLARELVRAGVANVLGWDGSVRDSDAAAFAQVFYKEASNRQTVVHAAASARNRLRSEQLSDANKGKHWHLARLYLGSGGGGALTIRSGKMRALAGRGEHFLDSERGEVPVAGHDQFVGRRRHIQHILRAYRDGGKAVLIHGMGCLGKSSLASRICDRMTNLKPVIIFGRYDELGIFDAVSDAVPPGERNEMKSRWRTRLAERRELLADALEDMLCGPLNAHPILLIVDDLEQILETPNREAEVVGVRPEYRTALCSVLSAFKNAQCGSRLLMTSRYRFCLIDGRGRDLTSGANMVCEHLRPMRPIEQWKQWQARARGDAAWDSAATAEGTLRRAIKAADGNPGLQDILTRPILSGEIDAAEEAITRVERFQAGGVPPGDLAGEGDSENAVGTFFRRVALEAYRDALTEEQKTMLRASLIFSTGIPIPVSVLEAVGRAAKATDPAAAIRRLEALGLLDRWMEKDPATMRTDVPVASVNPLARPLFPRPAEEEHSTYAETAVPLLAAYWSDADGDCILDRRIEELARLALSSHEIDPVLLIRIANAVVRYTDFLSRRGDVDGALRILREEVLPLYERLGEIREIAVCKGRIADILSSRGEVDEALRIRREEALPVYERLGDIRSMAVCKGKIADILSSRGEVDEALRIRREEELPVYERLGEIRDMAVCKGEIADILSIRGEVDEALRIYREEALPVLERLGDIRSMAVCKGKIADILSRRGEVDEALRINREEVLPVYERLGDIRGMAVCKAKIADILSRRGEVDEALRINHEEVLPVFERLGDIREMAVCKGKIADILSRRGEVDEALRIYREEELPVYERLGEIREMAVCKGRIADILELQEKYKEALQIRREEELPVYIKLKYFNETFVTMMQIAELHEKCGEYDDALHMWENAFMPIVRKTGDDDWQKDIQGRIDALRGKQKE